MQEEEKKRKRVGTERGNYRKRERGFNWERKKGQKITLGKRKKSVYVDEQYLCPT